MCIRDRSLNWSHPTERDYKDTAVYEYFTGDPRPAEPVAFQRGSYFERFIADLEDPIRERTVGIIHRTNEDVASGYISTTVTPLVAASASRVRDYAFIRLRTWDGSVMRPPSRIDSSTPNPTGQWTREPLEPTADAGIVLFSLRFGVIEDEFTLSFGDWTNAVPYAVWRQRVVHGFRINVDLQFRLLDVQGRVVSQDAATARGDTEGSVMPRPTAENPKVIARQRFKGGRSPNYLDFDEDHPWVSIACWTADGVQVGIPQCHFGLDLGPQGGAVPRRIYIGTASETAPNLPTGTAEVPSGWSRTPLVPNASNDFVWELTVFADTNGNFPAWTTGTLILYDTYLSKTVYRLTEDNVAPPSPGMGLSPPGWNDQRIGFTGSLFYRWKSEGAGSTRTGVIWGAVMADGSNVPPAVSSSIRYWGGNVGDHAPAPPPLEGWQAEEATATKAQSMIWQAVQRTEGSTTLPWVVRNYDRYEEGSIFRLTNSTTPPTAPTTNIPIAGPYGTIAEVSDLGAWTFDEDSITPDENNRYAWGMTVAGSGSGVTFGAPELVGVFNCENRYTLTANRNTQPAEPPTAEQLAPITVQVSDTGSVFQNGVSLSGRLVSLLGGDETWLKVTIPEVSQSVIDENLPADTDQLTYSYSLQNQSYAVVDGTVRVRWRVEQRQYVSSTKQRQENGNEWWIGGIDFSAETGRSTVTINDADISYRYTTSADLVITPRPRTTYQTERQTPTRTNQAEWCLTRCGFTQTPGYETESPGILAWLALLARAFSWFVPRRPLRLLGNPDLPAETDYTYRLTSTNTRPAAPSGDGNSDGWSYVRQTPTSAFRYEWRAEQDYPAGKVTLLPNAWHNVTNTRTYEEFSIWKLAPIEFGAAHRSDVNLALQVPEDQLATVNPLTNGAAGSGLFGGPAFRPDDPGNQFFTVKFSISRGGSISVSFQDPVTEESFRAAPGWENAANPDAISIVRRTDDPSPGDLKRARLDIRGPRPVDYTDGVGYNWTIAGFQLGELLDPPSIPGDNPIIIFSMDFNWRDIEELDLPATPPGSYDGNVASIPEGWSAIPLIATPGNAVVVITVSRLAPAPWPAWTTPTVQ